MQPPATLSISRSHGFVLRLLDHAEDRGANGKMVGSATSFGAEGHSSPGGSRIQCFRQFPPVYALNGMSVGASCSPRASCRYGQRQDALEERQLAQALTLRILRPSQLLSLDLLARVSAKLDFSRESRLVIRGYHYPIRNVASYQQQPQPLRLLQLAVPICLVRHWKVSFVAHSGMNSVLVETY
jgi:hypothetical protein